MAPFLNGELFKRKVDIDDQGLWIPDDMIGDFFAFLFQYNFTVEENEVYDEELELNPEFLGIIFERLTNMEQGAVYTPRVEVDLMCRLALVRWLEQTTEIDKRDLYHLFFRETGIGEAYDEFQKQGDFSPAEIRTLIERLENVTVCDPAAGSGAFEVGMLQVLEQVLENLYSRSNTPADLKARAPTSLERKKAIIANSLYGVEVKRWAVWINHLRLWLTLFVDMPDDYKNSLEPLLPNLTFKVRAGDSLVQRLGGKTFPVQGHANLPPDIKGRITQLKRKKRDFFYNKSSNYRLIEKEELDLFRAILDAQIEARRKEIRNLTGLQNRVRKTDLQQRNLYEFMRRLLVKRFESSFGAFAKSVDNFIRIHTIVLAFIERTGKYILDRKLIEKIWEEDEETIEEALEQFAAGLAEREDLAPHHDHIYVIEEFDAAEEFLNDVRADLALFQHIAERVETLKLAVKDPKGKCLVKAVENILAAPPAPGEPRRKVVIFSEYQDTIRHIAPTLEAAFPGRVLVAEGSLGKGFFNDLLANFDAGHPADSQRDAFDILVATDKLSEGVNLNRAGAVINYDIPWNPTRVIQRLGRINRIGQRVFETLYIYNFFPTEQGAEIVKSREIAAQKMFLIHNTLGEDAKIFAPEETPTPAELFRRINRNPEEEEEESLLTIIRREFFAIQREHPELVRGLADYPARVKTAKLADNSQLLVFRRKGLQLFIHSVPDTAGEKLPVQPLLLEEALPLIRCAPETPRVSLSPRFWPAYEAVKAYREETPMPPREQSLPVKAENNLRSALERYADDLTQYLPFIQTLLRDLKEYQTLPKYTLRRLTRVEMHGKVSRRQLARFRAELEALRRFLGDDYLARIEERIKDMGSEIIIAVENIEGDGRGGRKAESS